MYYTKHVYLDTNWVGVAYHRRFRGGGARVKNRVPKSVYFLLLGMRRTKVIDHPDTETQQIQP